MRDKLVSDINNYVRYLNEIGLSVTVHGQGISGLLEYNIHRNPFCSWVKTDAAAWQTCVKMQSKVFAKHKEEVIFGMCHAGVEEYVFFVNEKCFVSVSGYGIDRKKAMERIHALAEQYALNRSELMEIYEHGLKHEKENQEQLQILIRPLCHMLYLLQLLIADVPEKGTKSGLFDSILNYVQRNFMQNITVEDIARACACSSSTVSHSFKQNMGMSVKRYISHLRINQAKKLLVSSDLPVGTIAFMCGFENLNYFPTAFKKETGMAPSEYREKISHGR